MSIFKEGDLVKIKGIGGLSRVVANYNGLAADGPWVWIEDENGSVRRHCFDIFKATKQEIAHHYAKEICDG